MKYTCKIKLGAWDTAKEFVQNTSTFDFDIDVFYNRTIIDAKSLLGVLSLDLSKILTVRYGKDDPRFEEVLRKYCVV